MKAGFIPYIIRNGIPYFMFMVSSNSDFGGSAPAIAKGHMDNGESAIAAAIREAGEELGLKLDNVKQETIRRVWDADIKGAKKTYNMTIFMGEIFDLDNFDMHDDETLYTVWLSESDFAEIGRVAHREIVKLAADILRY
jgi:8-oxo-dGTP pyrophosphatase MutT (NUDIX family)